MSCEHDCDRPPAFPIDIRNRPGLAHVRYRLGAYSRMRAHMLDRLVKEPALAGWTHLGSDEPGIALLEGAALIGDILTFYQELYGNETWIGTARWQENVTDLIRLTGYCPAPGLGGAAVFALEVEGEKPVVVPAGFAIEAQLESFDAPSKFETEAALEAFPAFNAFHLYRPRLGLQPIAKGATSLDIVRFGDAADLATRMTAQDEIGEGDRIMILSGPFDPYEVLVVAEVETRLDRVTLHFEGAVQESHPAEVTAFKIGRTFRHYGADAPREFTTFRESPPKVFVHDTVFTRPTGASSSGSARYTALGARQMPLDQEVDDLAVGSRIVCTGHAVSPQVRDFALVRRIEKIIPRQVTWANVSAPVSMLRLNLSLHAATLSVGYAVDLPIQLATVTAQAKLFTLDSEAIQMFLVGGGSGGAEPVFQFIEPIVAVPAGPPSHDIRRLRLHETLGPKMILRAPPKQKPGAIADGRVNFFGTREEAEALAGRRLLLSGLTEVPQEIVAAADQDELAALAQGPLGDRRMWPIRLTSLPEAGAAGFAETDPGVTVYGNLVDATEGESQAETAIGTGDARIAFQTFALPKAPLTFLPDPARTPPNRAQLEIRVAGRLWQPVDTFFDRPADAEIYVIRQDEAGKDVVQFGDGVNGARLPSGRSNVTAAYRIGSGARGDLEADAEAKPKGKLKALTGVEMPGPATGGAAPESMDNARTAAPLRMRSLGRLVGLSDYEAEALSVPGVVKAGATFGAGEVPAIDLTVLTEDESPEAVAAVEAALRHADRCRGPARHALNVIGGRRRWVAIVLQAGYDPAFRRADLDAAVSEALGALPELEGEAPEDGLFSLARRRFGQDAHVSQAVAAAQQVEGVVWVRAVTFRRLAASSDDPAEIPLPATPLLVPRLGAAPTEVLALSARHLVLDAATVTSDEECPE